MASYGLVFIAVIEETLTHVIVSIHMIYSHVTVSHLAYKRLCEYIVSRMTHLHYRTFGESHPPVLCIHHHKIQYIEYTIIIYNVYAGIWWLRLVGSIKLYVSFAEYCLFYWALLRNL